MKAAVTSQPAASAQRRKGYFASKTRNPVQGTTGKAFLHMEGILWSLCNTQNTFASKILAISSETTGFPQRQYTRVIKTFSCLMSKAPPQISLTHCMYSTTLSISPIYACLWDSSDRAATCTRYFV